MTSPVVAWLRIWFVVSTMLALCSLSWPLQAQGIESILAPGQLVQGHAKLAGDCKQCHVKFDRTAQSALCLVCHQAVALDVKGKSGLHGRIKAQACNVCHTDHKGREARIVLLDKQKFDHAQSDFQLRGKHQPLVCEKCHTAGKKYRDAPLQCNACHRKDDSHKGALGVKCADCHNESSWRESRFDHATTRFALQGKHVDVKCKDCHTGGAYKDTPRTCNACHKKDDDSAKGHKGQFADKCDTCHSAKEWKPSRFNHDLNTKYDLRGKHRTLSCIACHSGPLYRVKLSQDCNACHAKDDKHKQTLGKNCASCHSERSWKESVRFDHAKSSFPLLGKHANVQCKGCHTSALFKDAPKQCIGCHLENDKHQTNLGTSCADCHRASDWKDTRGLFKHEQSKFVLRGAHASAQLKCQACHKDLRSFRQTPTECFSCHQKDDKHEGQLGKTCASCHTDANWRVERFNHALSRFALSGKHLLSACKSCHLTARFKDAALECIGCHLKEDKHLLKFGEKCASCHHARSWKLWDFNHDKRSKYVLDGAHRKLACDSCHRQPAAQGKNAAPLPSDCLSCHKSQDVHDSQFGVRCEQCHVTESWNNFQRRLSLSLLSQNGKSP